MGKILIIKGADFSANAVAHEILEPTDYINIAGYGATETSYSVGDVFYYCNGNLTLTNCGLYIKTDSGKEKATFDIDTIVKINGLYFTVATAANIYILPYYGLSSLNLTFDQRKAYKFVDENTEPTEVSGDYFSCVLNLEANKKYVICSVGSTKINVAIIKHSDGKFESLMPSQTGVKFIEYTAIDGDKLYFSRYTTSGAKYFVAKVW